MNRKILIGATLIISVILLGLITFYSKSTFFKPDKNVPIDSKIRSIEHDQINQKETTKIFQSLIQEKSIKPDSLINSDLVPYLPYTIKYTEEGMEVPPPPFSLAGKYVNETDLIKFLNSDNFQKTNDSIEREFFSDNNDLKNLRKQIKVSKHLSEKTSLRDWNFEFKGHRNKKDGYHFYVPLFNFDSTQVYIQYDYYNGVFGKGDGVIMIKEDNEWRVVRMIDIWIS